jgi:glycosyltransferase involved in cell wall biosynthesis
LFTGRIAPEKGALTLVRAFEALQLRGLSNLRLRLCGVVQDQEHFRLIENVLLGPAVGDTVEILPPRQRDEMPQLYAEADIAVFPSEWDEPFGLSLVEAMACSLPVVTTRSAGPSEIARDRDTALMFTAGDVQQLADRLQWVVENPAEAAQIGRAASEDVRRRFDLPRQVSEFERHVMSAVS